MSDNLKDILSNLNPDIDQETLLRYLQGKLTPAEQHELEKGMMEDHFNSDALDGLQDIKNKKNISLLLQKLSTDLKKKTNRKKNLKEKMALKLPLWMIIAIILILLFAVIGFIVVHRQMQS